MLVKIRFCPKYHNYDKYRDMINHKVNLYYDDDWREMQQLDFIVDINNELVIELLEMDIRCNTGQNINYMKYHYLRILDNIFCDKGNLASDVNEYFHPEIYYRYKSIINGSGYKPLNYTKPNFVVDEYQIDKTYKIDFDWVGDFRDIQKYYDCDDECDSERIQNGEIKYFMDFYDE